MTLQEIKDQLSIPTFHLNTATDAAGAKTLWMRHWDDTNRVAVSIHKDTIDTIKSTPNVNLGLQVETRTATESKKAYEAYRIVMYTPAEMTL